MDPITLAQIIRKGSNDDKLSPEKERELAILTGFTLKEIQIAALRQGIVPERFDRSMGTVGLKGQIHLLEATVAVAGCGGLGGLVVDLLARSGVGRLHLADGDHFSASNLNRQILSSEPRLGKGKAETAAEQVRSINEAIDVEIFADYLDENSIGTFLEGANVAVDALDNNRSRRLLLRSCRERSIPLVHGAIGGFWGQLQVIRGGGRTLFDGDGDKGVEATTGNPSFTPALIASLEVTEVVKLLTGLPPLPEGVLLWVDLERLEFRRLQL